jgi:hypothetical protein
MDRPSVQHEFKVVIEGVALSQEMVERINQAVQKVVLTEIANIDLRGDLAMRIPSALIGNGGTKGIWIRALTAEQAKGLGLG